MLYEVIKQKHIEAMKARDALLKSAYGNVIAKAVVAEKSGKYQLPLADEVIEGLIQKEIKELNETAQGFVAAQRYQDAGNVEIQIETLEQYLPKMMTVEEVEDLIRKAAVTETNKGRIIGIVAKQVGNRFDKKLIKGLVEITLG